MKTIWKYTMTSRISDFEVPIGGKVLTVQLKSGDAYPSIWILVDPSQPREIRKFQSHGTGHADISDSAKYIGTFQINDLVHHVFEE